MYSQGFSVETVEELYKEIEKYSDEMHSILKPGEVIAFIVINIPNGSD